MASERLLKTCVHQEGSVGGLQAYAAKNGIVGKSRKNTDGSTKAAQPFSKDTLYHLLSNPIYLGKIKHKEEVYEGLHDAVIDQVTWIKVQEQLANQRVGQKTKRNTVNASPLAGIVFDTDGKSLTPTHANKAGKRYGYYISKNIKTETGEVWRLSAPHLEQAMPSIGLNA